MPSDRNETSAATSPVNRKRRFVARVGIWVGLLLNVVSLGALSLYLFNRNEASIFLRWDGHFHLSTAKTFFDWVPPSLNLPMNFLQGVGDVTFPTIYTFMPAFYLGHLAGGDPINQPVTLTILALELFAATIFLGTVLGLRPIVSIVAGWISCLLFMPYFMPSLTYIRVWGNPPMVEAIAITAVLMGLMVLIGRNGRLHAWGMGAIATLLLAYLAITQAAGIALALPAIGFFYLVALAAAQSHEERKLKLIVGCTSLTLFMISFGPYFYGLYGFNVPAFFWSEFVPTTITPQHASFFFHPHEEGKVLSHAYFYLVIAFSVLMVFVKAGFLRRYAMGYLAFLATLWGSAYIIQLVNDGIWVGPPSGYIDMMAIPLQALMFAFPIGYIIDLAWCNARKFMVEFCGVVQTAIILAVATVPWAATAVSADFANVNWPWPPHATPITNILREDIGLHHGSAFKGRVVNLGGTHAPGHASPFYPAYSLDHVMRSATGNEHRYMGLWFFNIPTFHVSSQFYSPFYNLINMKLLNLPGTKNARPQTQTTEFNPRIMRSLGVSWVLDDQLRTGEGVVAVEKLSVPSGQTLYLHKLEGANIGDWSPVTSRTVDDMRAAVQALADPSTDLRKTVISFEPLPENLVPAQSDGIQVELGEFTIAAQSSGLSLLLLPVEYSHCLVPELDTQHPQDLKLVRLNVNLTGVLFRGSVSGTLRYRYGPLTNTTCRIKDWDDAKRFKLVDTDGWWP